MVTCGHLVVILVWLITGTHPLQHLIHTNTPPPPPQSQSAIVSAYARDHYSGLLNELCKSNVSVQMTGVVPSSNAAHSLVCDLLQFDPNDRHTSQSVLSRSFITGANQTLNVNVNEMNVNILRSDVENANKDLIGVVKQVSDVVNAGEQLDVNLQSLTVNTVNSYVSALQRVETKLNSNVLTGWNVRVSKLLGTFTSLCESCDGSHDAQNTLQQISNELQQLQTQLLQQQQTK